MTQDASPAGTPAAPVNTGRPAIEIKHATKKFGVLVADGFENILAVIDKIHFVDADSDLLYAQHAQQIPVPPRIFANAFFGVDYKQTRFGAGGAGDHVLEELDMSRRIDDDILSL